MSLAQHTLHIYKNIHKRLPPLIPEDLVHAIRSEIERLEMHERVSAQSVEDSMSLHAVKAWPYIKAFEDIARTHEDRLGGKLLMQKASPSIRKKYALVCELGGNYEMVCRGQLMDSFEHHERQELSELLVDIKQDIRKHAMQAILTHDRRTYEEKVEYYGKMITEINQATDALKKFAGEHRESHPDLTEEVESKVQSIAESLVFLGPSIDMEEIQGIHEHYIGRKQEKRFK